MALTDLSVAQRKKLRYNDPRLDAYAEEMTEKYGLPPGLLVALKNQGERTDPWRTSPAGAKGVMQLMPPNIKQFKVADPFDPVDSIEGAAKYLQATSKQYGGNVVAMVADYNGGPRQAKAARRGEQPASAETQKYLQNVLPALGLQLTPGPSAMPPATVSPRDATPPARTIPGRLQASVAPAAPAATAQPSASDTIASTINAIIQREMVVPEPEVPEGLSPLEQLVAMQQSASAAEQAAPQEVMDPWQQQLMSSALGMEVDSARQDAVSSFFGEDPVMRVPLPPAIDEAINRFVANI